MMQKVQKNVCKEVKAWILGENSSTEAWLISKGKIVVTVARYELFSQEVKSDSGEKAIAGDYFKIDGSVYSYPNKKYCFLANHHHIEGDTWEQLPAQLDAWKAEENIPEEVQFLLYHKGLKLNPANPSEYFGAKFFGYMAYCCKRCRLQLRSSFRVQKRIITTANKFPNWVAKSLITNI